jgi:hypothetical protein
VRQRDMATMLLLRVTRGRKRCRCCRPGGSDEAIGPTDNWAIMLLQAGIRLE